MLRVIYSILSIQSLLFPMPNLSQYNMTFYEWFTYFCSFSEWV